jgi:CHAD domain-containing protein
MATEYLLPSGTDPAAASELLAAHLDVQGDGTRSVLRTYYDTFDGRLHAAGLTLLHEDGRLALVERGESADLPEAPDKLLAEDLRLGPLRDVLAPVIDVRALLPIARVRSRERPLRVLDDEGKTVVRLVVEAPAKLSPRLHVIGVRGYDKDLNRVRRALDRKLGLEPASAPVRDEAVAASGGAPGGISSKPDIALRPGERTDRAAAAVLGRLAATIEVNLPGTLADVDTEFLHDLRVAVRRTRSVQRELARAFPPEPLARFRADFRWLQQITGPTRDLDVNLLEFDDFREAVPDLEPLHGLLVERRRRERRRMVRSLRSAKAGKILSDWSAFLDGLEDAPVEDRPDAEKPIQAVAGRRIARVYGRMVKMGSAIDDASPHEALHDLRKKGKELRYLLELFGGVFPADVTKPMVRTLKALQDTLGRFQDREVQADLVRSLAGEISDTRAVMAIGVLAEHLTDEQEAARAEFAERFAAFAAKPQRRLVAETFG